MKVLLTSDIHDCHLDWYGVKTENRISKWAADICAEHEREPLDMILMLGDYALDFWFNGGTYVNKKESRTKHFLDTYASRLPKVPTYLIPGNHEQYAPEDWKRITGCERYVTAVMGNSLFIMTDSYAGDLGPDTDADGTYVPADCGYIREQLAKYDCPNVFLCTHGWEPENETEEFKELVRTESRIKCLFQGHYHRSFIKDPGEEYGHKCILQTGNYSYTSDSRGPAASFWGYRLLYIDDTCIRSEYINCDCDFVHEGKPQHIDRHPSDSWEQIQK